MYFIFGLVGDEDGSTLRGAFFDTPDCNPQIIIEKSTDDELGHELKKSFRRILDQYDSNITLVGLDAMDTFAFEMWFKAYNNEDPISIKQQYNIYDLSKIIGLKINTNEKTLDNIFKILKSLQRVNNLLAT